MGMIRSDFFAFMYNSNTISIMKKLMIMAVAGLLIVACDGKKESKSVAEQAYDYSAQLDSVAATGDSAAVVNLSKEIEEWQASLSEEDKKEASQNDVYAELATKVQTAASGNVKELIQKAISAATNGAVDVANTATDAANGTADVATDAVNAVGDAADAVTNEAKTQAKEVKDAAKKKATDAVNNAQQKTSKAIDDAASKASSKASEAVKNAGNDAKKALGL